MSSVIVRNMLFANLLQCALSAPRSSSREDFPMVHHAFSRRPAGIHSLPVELLTRIFVLGSGFDYPYTDSPFLLKPVQENAPVVSSNFQVIVSHVCHHWREVALRTPSLWTTLHFREASNIHRAKTYLARCSLSNHTPGITLYKDEILAIFQIIIPHVQRWRAFHLKICDNECKGQARQFLSTCGPAPNLETLQLYHFEDYRTSQRLYLATYRPPVVVFSNSLPCLKNVSLIGVNLPWAKSPYLKDLHSLELALHLDAIRPAYEWWDRMLRLSPELKTLCLHYSGPREATNDPTLAWPSTDERIHLHCLQELSLTDLDPDFLCNVVERLHLPNVKKLILDLPDQDFTPFIELITGPPPRLASFEDTTDATCPTTSSTSRDDFSPSISLSSQHAYPSLPIPSIGNLEVLSIRALECSPTSLISFLRATRGLRVLEVDFARVGAVLCKIFTQDFETQTPGVDYTEQPPSIEGRTTRLLPLLEVVKISGVSGKDILSALHYRHRQSRDNSPPCSEKWIVGWNERRRGSDLELDDLVDRGCWGPVNGNTETKIIIEPYDDEDDEVEEPDNEVQGGSDEDEAETDDPE